MTNINLPAISQHNTEDLVKSITSSLDFPRTVLAEEFDIEIVWNSLGRELRMIKPEYRHEILARMLIAIRVGLFSSAVNEIWNTSILAIKKKITSFGLHEAGQLLGKDLSEKKFKELTDKDLLDISIELAIPLSIPFAKISLFVTKISSPTSCTLSPIFFVLISHPFQSFSERPSSIEITG